jgi:methylaspartate mutase sigma subunit
VPSNSKGGDRLTAVLTTVSSDSHTWNLLYLELLLREMGLRVVNLGACVPVPLVVETCRRVRPDLLVVSTVNGHGHTDGSAVVARLRATEATARIPAIIGGKLGVDGSAHEHRQALLAAGYDAVFDDAGAEPVGEFLRDAVARLCRPVVS